MIIAQSKCHYSGQQLFMVHSLYDSYRVLFLIIGNDINTIAICDRKFVLFNLIENLE